VTFLIDGYNLMFAAGLVSRTTPAAHFDRARTRFLDWLADGAKARAELRVVFDAQQAPAASRESAHRGVRVRFAFRQTADDLIEQMLATEPRPELLAVVSNDSRVREAARRAGSAVTSCEEFMDWLLESKGNQGADAPRSPDQEKPAPGDVSDLLDVFSKPKPKR
jgi:predicted RNA-binding protein with PIN domain